MPGYRTSAESWPGDGQTLYGFVEQKPMRIVHPSATSTCPATGQELFWFLIAEKGYKFCLFGLRRVIWEHSVRTESAARDHVNNYATCPVTRALAILGLRHSGIPSINDTPSNEG